MICEKCEILIPKLESAYTERNDALALAARMERIAQNAGQEKREKHVKRSDKADQVGLFWQDKCDRRGSKLLEGRVKRINWALNHWSVEEIEWAILGYALSNWHMGRDPRTKGRKYNDLARHILKDESSVEWGIANWHREKGAQHALAVELVFGAGIEWAEAYEVIDLRWQRRSQQAYIKRLELALGEERARGLRLECWEQIKASENVVRLGVAA